MTARPEAVLFDWDGTLVDSWPVIHESMNLALSAMGRAPWSLDETRERARHSLRDAFPGIFGDRWEEARDLFHGHYRSLHLSRLAVIDGAEDLVAAFHGLGCRLGVVSNKSGRHLRAESEHLGWGRFFGARLVGAGDAERDKPAVEPVLMALDGTGIAPSGAVWFVGDTWVDMACATAAGCRSVLVGDADPAGDEFAPHRPDAHFPSSRELLRLARNL